MVLFFILQPKSFTPMKQFLFMVAFACTYLHIQAQTTPTHIQQPQSDGGSYEISSGNSVELVAENSITLKDGVWFKPGSDVHLRIGQLPQGDSNNEDVADSGGGDSGGSGTGSDSGSGSGTGGSTSDGTTGGDSGTDEDGVDDGENPTDDGSGTGSDVITTRLVFVFDEAGNQTWRNPDAVENESTVASLKTEILLETPPELSPEDITEAFVNSIVIYPNPTSGNLTMEWDAQFNDLITEVKVVDMSSRSIGVNHQENSNEARVDLTRYPTGVYFVNFYLRNDKIAQKKIIKK